MNLYRSVDVRFSLISQGSTHCYIALLWGFLWVSPSQILGYFDVSLCFSSSLSCPEWWKRVLLFKKKKKKIDLRLQRVQNRLNSTKICNTSAAASASQRRSAELLLFFRTMMLALRSHIAGTAVLACYPTFSVFNISAPIRPLFTPIVISHPYTCKTTKLAKNMLEICIKKQTKNKKKKTNISIGD